MKQLPSLLGLAKSWFIVSSLLLVAAAMASIAFGCGGSGSGSDGPENPDLVNICWGPADVYHTLDVALVDDAADVGIGCIVLEQYPTVQAKNWRTGQELDSFPDVAREWADRAYDRGMFVIVFGVNWNVLPWRLQGDAWMEKTFAEILATYDPSRTWLEFLVEVDENPFEKARRWTSYSALNWPGVYVMGSAAAARFSTKPTYVDYHPSSPSNLEHRLNTTGPGSLTITDGGDFVHPPSVMSSIAPLTKLALDRGNILGWYTDRYAPHDNAAHRAVISEIGSGIREYRLGKDD